MDIKLKLRIFIQPICSRLKFSRAQMAICTSIQSYLQFCEFTSDTELIEIQIEEQHQTNMHIVMRVQYMLLNRRRSVWHALAGIW